jgi:hypothetical protein
MEIKEKYHSLNQFELGDELRILLFSVWASQKLQLLPYHPFAPLHPQFVLLCGKPRQLGSPSYNFRSMDR